MTHAIAGKTITHIIPAGPAGDRTREQLDEYHRFRELVQQWITVSEQICGLESRQPASSFDENIKKTAFDDLLAAEILHDVEALFRVSICVISTWKHSNQRYEGRRSAWRLVRLNSV